MARIFVDSNVFLYTLDHRDPTRKKLAEEVLEEVGGQMVASVQVLQEVYSSAIRKLRLPTDFARAVVEQMAAGQIVEPSATMVIKAIDTSERHRIHFYDAMIIEAAIAGHCSLLLTEDLNHGQVIRGVKIRNPFSASA